MTVSPKPTILVGLSGGVDSAVAAYLLIQQGYTVIAGFMKNYADPDNPHCTTRADRDMALKVAEHLGIKTFIIFDFRAEYESRIISYIYDGYKQGITPNPDVFCNNLVKFDLFLEQALSLGCVGVATGHYARLLPPCQGRVGVGLVRAIDHTKDQSYFLSRLSQHQLSHAYFPLGDMTKVQVRELAHQIGLPNAHRPDSQGLCFIGKVSMHEFLKRRLPETQGNILDQTGKVVGTHMGAWFYTLGQKTQLFLPYRAYICAIDVTTNTLTVSADKETHQLYTSQITFTQRQRSGTYTNHIYTSPIPCQVKCRYRQDPIPAQIVYTDGIYMCITHDPQRAVTPGQIVVAYDDHECVIGSGIIASSI